jgi:hypothetical protein
MRLILFREIMSKYSIGRIFSNAVLFYAFAKNHKMAKAVRVGIAHHPSEDSWNEGGHCTNGTYPPVEAH